MHLNNEELAMCADFIMEDRFEELPEKYKTHLKECDACSREVNMICSISSDTIDQISIKETHRFNIRKVVRVAASIAVITVVGSSVFHIISDRQTIVNETEAFSEELYATNDSLPFVNSFFEDTIIEEEKNSVEKEIEAEIELNNSFIPNSEMERLVERYSKNNVYRSDSSVNDLFIILKGHNGELLIEVITDEVLFIEIIDNEENIIREIDLKKGGNNFDMKVPGLYYIKVMNEDFDLLFCDKITIKK
jgi:hypothetical protein